MTDTIKIGVDAGGTTIRIVAYRDCGEGRSPRELERMEFTPRFYDQDMRNLVLGARHLSGKHGRIVGMGLSVAGQINPLRTGLMKGANNLHWVDQPLVEILSEALECPVVIGNDAQAAALAEALWGFGRGVDFWLVIWGTGIGGCLVRVVDHQPMAFPGEPGHMTIPVPDLRSLPAKLARPLLRRSPKGRLCNCGQIDCWEAYAGGGQLHRFFGCANQDATKEQWLEVAQNFMVPGLRNLALTQPVKRIVLSGSVAPRQPWLIRELGLMLSRTATYLSPPPEVALSIFGESAGAVGGVALLGQ